MANTIRIKRRAAGGSVGAPSSLLNAELAYNEQDNVLYYGTGLSGVGTTAASILSIAGAGAYTTLGTSQTISGNKTFSGTLNAITQAINDSTTLVATTAYVKSQNYITTAIRLDQLASPNAAIAFNAQKITGLADPTSAQDAATKNYVDAMRQGLSVKDAVRAATTVNISLLSGTLVIDGVTLSINDRVLVKDQTNNILNGLYKVASGAWDRTVDADAPTSEISGGTFVFVQEGVVNADSGWVCTNDSTVTIGTTGLTFAQFSGAGQITAGTGLSKTGNTINISTVPVANGGTGATTLTGIVKGTGTSAFTAAVDGTDYLSPVATIDGGTY